MSFISKNDKKIWESYIANFESFSLKFENEKRVIKNSDKKERLKKSELKSHPRLIIKGRDTPEGVLDLHGYRLQTAKIILQKYIINAYEKNIRNILVITGKGLNNTGVLKKEVPIWLNSKNILNFVINHEIAPKKFGGEGALLVRIKNKHKNMI